MCRKYLYSFLLLIESKFANICSPRGSSERSQAVCACHSGNGSCAELKVLGSVQLCS
jgi:hypothetical protein